MSSRSRTFLLAVVTALLVATTGPAHADVEQQRVDINTASAAELASLPGIGDSKAQAIIEHRTADPFRTIEDLKKVKGIGDKTFEALRPSLMVSSAAEKK